MDLMSVSGWIFGIVVVVCVFVITWPLAELIIPQSEIDKIDAIGKWAKEELECREAERREGGKK